MYVWFILYLFCAIPPLHALDYELNDEEYSRLPPLVWLDVYSACLRRPGGRFCTAYASYVDGDPALLTIMQFSISGRATSRLRVTIEGEPIQQVENTTFLGFEIDRGLTWSSRIDKQCAKLGSACFALGRLSRVVSADVVRTCYFATVHSVLQYGAELWGHAADRLRAFRMQKRAVRAIAKVSRRTSARPFFKSLGIPTLPAIFIIQLAMYVRKNIETLDRREDTNNLDMALRSDGKLASVWMRLEKSRRLTHVMGPEVYNCLPEDIRNAKYSADSSIRFNHSRALFGSCVSQNCKSEEETTLNPKRLLEGCLNRTVWDKYKLKVKLDDEIYCHDHGEKKPDLRTTKFIVAAILLGLIVCNLIGSLSDIYWSRNSWKDGSAGQFLLFFSIPRSWKLLTAPPDPKMESLNGLYGIKAITTLLVLVLHSLLPASATPENPKYIEDAYTLPIIYILLNVTVVIQTFLFISAFLLAYCCQHHGIQITWRTLPGWVRKRWLRLTPAYAVVLAVTATWLPYTSSGPLWDRVVVAEATSCRAVWWQHLLYINNYFDDTLCMRQTWYLAVDMQLSCLGLLVLACRSPRTRQVALAALFLVGLLLPTLTTYLHDTDGIVLISPSSGTDMFLTNAEFNLVYKRTHNNLCSYVLGLAAGYLVHALQTNNFSIDKYKCWRPLYWQLVPALFLVPACCQVFYRTPRLPLHYRVLAAALIKPVFGALIGAIIVGMVFKMESLYRGILSWRGWVPLSRVSFSTYLLHMAYIMPSFGSLQYPIHMSLIQGIEIVVSAIVIINVLAGLFWLTVEAPLSHVVKYCFKIHTPQKAQKESID